jgi:hypothetical protein
MSALQLAPKKEALPPDRSGLIGNALKLVLGKACSEPENLDFTFAC